MIFLNAQDYDRYWGTFSKVAIWSLVQYDSLIYIDADGIVLKNLNHLFDVIDPLKNIIIAAQLAPGCDLPTEMHIRKGECEFQTAFLVIKPQSDIFKYLVNNVKNASRKFEGELPYLNQVFWRIYTLPKWTSIPQTTTERPITTLQIGDREESSSVDWNQVYSYDFSGKMKPWYCYQHQKDNGSNAHPFFGNASRETAVFSTYIVPLHLWYNLYEDLQEQKETRSQATRDHFNRKDEF